MVDSRRLLDAVWRGHGKRARFVRSLITPLEWLYSIGVATRGAMYDRGLLTTHQFSVPVLSVGNLTVGGTGKTPVSAWFAQRFLEKGVSPAIVLRGYGGDETIVHQRLNPGIPVIAAADRVRGIGDAIRQGAKVVVLDDAFQHRRAQRDADVILINADVWTGSTRLLPTGPWREPLRSARRASLVMITRKTAEQGAVDDLRRALSQAASGIPTALVHLGPAELRSTATGQTLPLQAIDGADLTAVAAIADPDAFFKQLTRLGAIVRPHSFPDHHAFTAADALELARESASSDFVVCTLKDAVKLETMWPADAGSLWYVSQRLRVEDGKEHLDRLVDQLVARAHE